MIELYLSDLTPKKQLDITEAFGDNNNLDVFPIAVIVTPEEYEKL